MNYYMGILPAAGSGLKHKDTLTHVHIANVLDPFAGNEFERKLGSLFATGHEILINAINSTHTI